MNVKSPLSAGVTFKHYELIRQLGEGGMGIVYLARDTKLGRNVAIKVLLEDDAQRVTRFLAEAQALAGCEHENVVVIHEVDEVGGYPYMVLEHVQGRTLRDLMRQRRGALARISPRRAAALMIPVVRALGAVHRRGVVHLDLKPENILLAGAGTIKVVDFGVALRLGAEERPRIRGTPAYMAPEQLRADVVDRRADLWAVGVLLYELVAGAHPLEPFPPGWRERAADLDAPIPSAHEARPDLGALGDVIDRCLKKRAPERFASAGELLAALERVSARTWRGRCRGRRLAGTTRARMLRT